MISTLSELELSCIDRLDRAQLIQTIRARTGDLPADLLERLEEQPTEHLQLLLLAGRLVQVLRCLRQRR